MTDASPKPSRGDRPIYTVNVEADDRTVLFPAGKFLSHLLVHAWSDERVQLDAVFTFNQAKEPALLAELDIEEARDLSRAIVDAVFQGRTQHVITPPETRLGVVFNPNGFTLVFGEGDAARDLFIASPAILRVAQAMLRAVDALEAPQTH